MDRTLNVPQRKPRLDRTRHRSRGCGWRDAMAATEIVNLQAPLSMSTNLTSHMPPHLIIRGTLPQAILWMRLNITEAHVRRATLQQWCQLTGTTGTAHHYRLVSTPLPTGGHNDLPEM